MEPDDDVTNINSLDIVHMVAHELWLQSLIPNAMAFADYIEHLRGIEYEADVP